MAEPVHVDHSPQVLVVSSPGPLVGGVTPENILTHPSKPRNPGLARAARTVGIAEEVGRGVDRIVREMIRSGRTPTASYQTKRCDACSLIELCQPKLLGKGRNVEAWLHAQISEEP